MREAPLLLKLPLQLLYTAFDNPLLDLWRLILEESLVVLGVWILAIVRKLLLMLANQLLVAPLGLLKLLPILASVRLPTGGLILSSGPLRIRRATTLRFLDRGPLEFGASGNHHGLRLNGVSNLHWRHQAHRHQHHENGEPLLQKLILRPRSAAP